MHIRFLYSDQSGAVDGIRDYIARLSGALMAHPDVRVSLSTRAAGHGWRADGLLPTIAEDPDVLFLQYNPYAYGRAGFAPGLLRAVTSLTRRYAAARLVVMVHETYVRGIRPKVLALGAWQRIQLAALARRADMLLVTTEEWARAFRWLRAHPTFHLPVGSNLEDPSSHTQAVAPQFDWSHEGGGFTLTTFGRSHPTRAVEHVAAAANAAAQSAPVVRLLNLGADALPVAGLCDRVVEYRPGYLPAATLSAHLACSDLYLAAYTDGVSTKRTTLMAALQHGLPVVGTYTAATDQVLLEARDAMRLLPSDDPITYGTAVRTLVEDKPLRVRMGEAARRLYRTRFDWPVIASQLVHRLYGELP